MADRPTAPVRIVVSACLLGEPVRYDGGHRRDPFAADFLPSFFELLPLCPETGCGLPVPREPMVLAGDSRSPRLAGIRSGEDFTGRLARWTEETLGRLSPLLPSALVCKAGSPSCGAGGIPVGGEERGRGGAAAGLFTAAFRRRFPLVPVEEEGRLADPAAQGLFVERVLALKRFRELGAGDRPRGLLVRFHEEHKYQLLAHGRGPYGEAGRLVARAGTLSPAELRDRYGEILSRALSVPATRRATADALLHAAGFFRGVLPGADRAELRASIEEYRLGRLPFSAPLGLFRSHLRERPVPWLSAQTFLDPHPAELALRERA